MSDGAIEDADAATVRPEPVDAEDKTVVVDREAEDGTVVVSRSGRSRKAVAEEDPTVVVDRDDEDRTVVVDRGEEDRTVVVDRPGTETDKTVAVDRKGRSKRVAPGAGIPDPESVLTLLPSRRGVIKTAPVERGSGREAVEAVGANVVEAYAPREIAPLPPAAPPVPRGDDALRADAPSMPSVSRQSRSAGVVTLLVFAGACVVSVIGIVAVIVWFVRS